MNKLVKGAIAGAAGIALLLGGAGTFALWNSTANVTGGTIVAGNLVVGAPVVPGTWKVAHADANGVYGIPVATTLANFKASPGDQLTYTTKVPVTAAGDNLQAAVSLTPGSIAATDPNSNADKALAGFLAATTTVSMSGTGISGTAPTYTITAGKGAGISTTATITATITFSNDTVGNAGAENTAMLGSVDLSGIALTLTQQ
jgi:alternate signal-mediated exported protein